MVRFIIDMPESGLNQLKQFTFQYGQIYYMALLKEMLLFRYIYIPIWLDLLLLVAGRLTL